MGRAKTFNFLECFMIINHNMSSIYAKNRIFHNELKIQKDIEKIASGMRINRAGDDASGLAVSEKMRAQIRGLAQAMRNAQDGISFIQTTEGYLQNSQDIIQRIRELAVQAANGIYTSEDRMQIQVEVSQLIDEVDRIASHAQFNGLNMLTGRFSEGKAENLPAASMWFHLGANMDQREQIFIGTMSATALGMKDMHSKQVLSLSAPEKANQALGTLDQAIGKINTQRAYLGTYQSRLEFAQKGLFYNMENTQAAESRIRDTEMANQIASFAVHNILQSASLSMLGQSNQKNQSVLQLLR